MYMYTYTTKKTKTILQIKMQLQMKLKVQTQVHDAKSERPGLREFCLDSTQRGIMRVLVGLFCELRVQTYAAAGLQILERVQLVHICPLVQKRLGSCDQAGPGGAPPASPPPSTSHSELHNTNWTRKACRVAFYDGDESEALAMIMLRCWS